ncbi:MAG: hypothetical protein COY40_02795, partial [Alphaproteobacteria bacterium CG_4_10_14_0_8_um_filter_53_9]
PLLDAPDFIRYPIRMKTYVLGFAFSPDKQTVLLIKKNRPTWQAGKLNGVGGKIEEGETPAQAMVREFEEGTGIKSTEADWQPYAHLGSIKDDANPWSMHVFCTFTLPLHTAQSQTDEEVMQVPVNLEKLGLIGITNLPWLIGLAIDPDLPRIQMTATYQGHVTGQA